MTTMSNKNRETSLAGESLREYLDYSFQPRLFDLLEAWLMGSHVNHEEPLFKNFTAFPVLRWSRRTNRCHTKWLIECSDCLLTQQRERCLKLSHLIRYG